jgi:hypothetical protein
MPSKSTPTIRGRKKRVDIDLGMLANALLQNDKELPHPAPDISEQLAYAAERAKSGEDMQTLDSFLLIAKSVNFITAFEKYRAQDSQTINAANDMPSAIHRDIVNLTHLAGSIQYNEDYWKFGNDMTDITLYYISKDNQLLDWQSEWSNSNKKHHLLFNAASKITFHATSAGIECSGLQLTDPNLTVFNKAPQTHPLNGMATIMLGYFQENRKRPAHPGTIGINDHEHGVKHDFCAFAHVPFHETVHSQQKDFGVMHAKRWNRKLGKLYQAGELWHFMAAAQAIIPPTIHQAYRAQFHEAAAHALHERFENGLRKIVGAPPTLQ